MLWHKERLISLTADIAAEVRGVVEVQLGRHLLCRELTVHHQVFDFHHGELSDPMAWGASAHLGGDFVQMLWRDAEFPCVIGYSPMFSVGSRLQQSDESRHDIGRPLSGLLAFEERGMSVHDIQIKGSHPLQNGVSPIGFGCVFRAESDILEVVLDNS